MRITENIKKSIQSWLEIKPADKSSISIDELYDYDFNAGINRIWLRGQSQELSTLYKSLNFMNYSQDHNATFWGADPLIPIHKIHSGLPSLIVKVLTNIVIRDLNAIELDRRDTEWYEIAEDNKFDKTLKKAIAEVLSIGDGAFKISLDPSVSKYPIIEFYPGDKVEYIYNRGRLTEVIFKTLKIEPKTNKKYLLKEHYGYGYVRYELFRMNNSTLDKTDLLELEETKELVDVVFGGYDENTNTKGDYMLAVPFSIFDSVQYEGRGESIFDKKRDSFDAFDEVISQWADAVRAGRAKTYIPDSLVPKNASGMDMLPNYFDDRFIKTGNDMSEGAKNQIEVAQPSIPSDNYLQSYISYLDLCLQGIISPSTLGIDTKKLDNAEAQREKEKTTLYTRNTIIQALIPTVRDLVITALVAKDTAMNKATKETSNIKVSVEFGEYANPSFEAVVETVTKAKQGGVMSIRTALDELYGDDKDEAWKESEAQRIAEENGAVALPEPNINNFIGN